MKKHLITLSVSFLLIISCFILKNAYLTSEEIETQVEAVEPVKMFFFWDTHFARGFEYFDESSKKGVWEYFKFFYDKKWNKLLKDMDVVSVNFESSLYNDENKCPLSWKWIILKTHEKYLSHFKNAWITHTDISNNHSYDCTKSWFEFMKKALWDNWLKYYWDGRIWEENVLKQEIKWYKIAFFWFNETTFYNDWDEKWARVKDAKEDGYIAIVNVHWGEEYKHQNNIKQKEIAKKLISYWADIIIGHHPHVVQNYEIIDWVPVFYSLWNFMFDQPFEETMTWMWVYLEITDDIKFKTVYFDRSNPFYEIKKLDFGL